MKVKTAIAKEGLILLAVIISGLVVYFAGRHFNASYLAEHSGARYKVIGNMKYCLVGYTPYLKVMSLGLSLAIFGYPVILLTRFVFWSLKTLKGKK